MKTLISIENVIAWSQRQEPKRGAFICTTGDGTNWIDPGDNTLHIAAAKKVGLYLGYGWVACIEKEIEP